MLEPIPDLTHGSARSAFRAEHLRLFAQHIYGHAPGIPDIEISKELLDGATRIGLMLRSGDNQMPVDAAFWQPKNVFNPPVVIALDFLGPLGLGLQGYPIDPNARVHVPDRLGGGNQLHEGLRGALPYRVPVQRLLDQGHAVLASCYGSWVPDCTDTWRAHGAATLIQEQTGAIALWAWAYRVLVRVAQQLCTPSFIAAAGHSRLGKAALWAAAQDDSIDAVFANQSGCFGAAPTAHPVGETPAQLIQRFPHWTIADQTAERSIDQHHLLALIAPRLLYLGQAKEDLWADPMGSIAALTAAAPAWGDATRKCGHHLRDGGHDMLDQDWAGFLSFLQSASDQCANP